MENDIILISLTIGQSYPFAYSKKLCDLFFCILNSSHLSFFFQIAFIMFVNLKKFLKISETTKSQRNDVHDFVSHGKMNKEEISKNI